MVNIGYDGEAVPDGTNGTLSAIDAGLCTFISRAIEMAFGTDNKPYSACPGVSESDVSSLPVGGTRQDELLSIH